MGIFGILQKFIFSSKKKKGEFISQLKNDYIRGNRLVITKGMIIICIMKNTPPTLIDEKKNHNKEEERNLVIVIQKSMKK